jgi:hypothetical protein
MDGHVERAGTCPVDRALGKASEASGLATLGDRARAGTRTPDAPSAAERRENDREDRASTVALEQKLALMLGYVSLLYEAEIEGRVRRA